MGPILAEAFASDASLRVSNGPGLCIPVLRASVLAPGEVAPGASNLDGESRSAFSRRTHDL